ncbi:MAG: DUF935 family protein [Phycisphaerae bacterium]|nr:DUF935 family protein [Phycisphaerae bacterium]
MTLFRTISNAVRSALGGRPKAGRIALPGPRDVGGILAGDMTAERLIGLLRRGGTTAPDAQSELFDLMLERDEDLANAERTRREALTGLEWELLSADQLGNRSGRIDEAAAQRAMQACLEMLEDIEGLEMALAHLATAVSYGLAVVEVEWGKGPSQMAGALSPIALHVVDHAMVTADMTDPRRLRLIWSDNLQGVLLDEQPAGKFIIHAPRAIGGVPYRGALLRPAAVGWLEKRYGRRWEMIWLELFGTPFRTATYPPDWTSSQIDSLLENLRAWGAAGIAIYPQGGEMQIHEGGGSRNVPHEVVIARVNAAYAKLFLGQTLTTEIGESGGSRAAATVHDEVRRDLLLSDARAELATIRRDLLRPFVAATLGDAALTPWFRRITEEPADLSSELGNLSIAVNELGLEIPARHASELAGVPLVEGADPEAAMPGRRGGGFDAFGDFAPQRESLRIVANRRLTELARRRSAIGRALGWVATAVLASQGHVFAMADSAAAIAADVRDADEAAAALGRLMTGERIADLVELERQLLLAGELSGRAAAREKTVRARFQAQARGIRGARWQANAGIDFARIPFVRAIEALRDRIGLTPDAFAALDAEARSRAWRVAGVYQMDLLAVLHQALVASIAAGETGRDFRRRLDEQMASGGWVGESPWHADVVHYQNFVMAHSAGRYREFGEADIQYWKFTAWGDTCPICEPNINKIFRMDDQRLAPPLHFFCDCVAEPMFDDEIEPGDAVDSRSIRNPALEAERARPSGFRWDPASYAAVAPLELARFPTELRGVFESFARGRGWEITA